MENKKKDTDKQGKSFSHLKWPVIVMAILIVLLIASFNYCSGMKAL